MIGDTLTFASWVVPWLPFYLWVIIGLWVIICCVHKFEEY